VFHEKTERLELILNVIIKRFSRII
jgi:hypothetical protein